MIALILALSAAVPWAAAAGHPREGLIALSQPDGNGRLQIFTLHLDGAGRKQLTFEGDNGRPAWSRDGRRIAFMHHRGPSRNPSPGDRFVIGVMDADGSHLRYLRDGGAPDWSPDGKRIAYCAAEPGSPNQQLYVMDADGGHPRQITRSAGMHCGPSWSPDGRRLAFIYPQTPDIPGDPKPRIGVVDADGTDERILTAMPRVNLRTGPDGRPEFLETAFDANAPAWSPVDDRIAFWSGIENHYGQIWTIRADGTGSRQLTDDPSHRNSDDPSWSPDGRKIVFSTARRGRAEAWVMNADGSDPRPIGDIDAFPFPGRAVWQPLPR